MKKQSKNVTKQDLRQMKAYLKFLQVADEAEANKKSDKYRHLANTKDMDCTIYNKEDYAFFKVFAGHKDVFQDIFTKEQWETIEANVQLYELSGFQSVKVKEEHYNIIDSLADEATIADIAKKLGKK